MRLLENADADELYRLIDANRAYLARWMPFVGQTRSAADSLAFIGSARRQLAENRGMQMAILSGVQARLAAILLTVMYAAFTPLVHLPLLLAAPGVYFNWTENALNLALVGAAWVVADSLSRPKNISPQPATGEIERQPG